MIVATGFKLLVKQHRLRVPGEPSTDVVFLQVPLCRAWLPLSHLAVGGSPDLLCSTTGSPIQPHSHHEQGHGIFGIQVLRGKTRQMSGHQ